MSTAPESENFHRLLTHLRQARGVDFASYKHNSLTRRITRRMQALGLSTYDAYLDHLQLHPDEFEPLFNTILINVTSFFRDPDVWSYVDTVFLPQLLERRPADEPLRVWCAGCASGEEPYSLAMLLAERLGLDAVRQRTKIYATDIDDEALNEARRARFKVADTSGLPPGFLEKYFSIDGNTAALNRDLRKAVLFGRIDLLRDAPISRVDLLLCRNTLMYFNSEAQARVLRRFSYAVNGHGFLVLGRPEMLFSHAAMFTPVDLPRRIFRVSTKAGNRDRMAAIPRYDNMSNGADPLMRLRQAAFDADPVPQLLIDASRVLVSASAGARQHFSVGSGDVGKLLPQLEVSYRPADLRTAIDRVLADRGEVILKDVHHFASGQPRRYDVTVAPVTDESHTLTGIRITFEDRTAILRLESELHASKQELETTCEELQSTNEELETTNEELETTNEELQSTNEELETMNEELQSTNEELQTLNDELRTRSVDADELNTYLDSIFSSLRSAVVVLDPAYRIRLWNKRAEDLWDLRSDETVGVPFLSLDIGLPVDELSSALRAVISGEQRETIRTIRSTTRRGKSIDCQVSIIPLKAGEASGGGLILLMDDAGQAG